jgi:hypothetical protein
VPQKSLAANTVMMVVVAMTVVLCLGRYNSAGEHYDGKKGE